MALRSATRVGQIGGDLCRRSFTLNDLIRTGQLEKELGRSLLSKSHMSASSSGVEVKPPPARMSKEVVVYEGPLASTLQRVKLLSLSTCCLSVSCGPALTFFTAGDLSVLAKGALASTMMLLSASTTAALHWIASPYVRKLTWVPGSKEMEVEILSWMATSLHKTIRIADVKAPETQRPLVTFAAEGNFYFIDKEKFPDQELLKKLTPQT